MPKVYRVRDKNSVLKMDLPDSFALEIINEDALGEWKTVALVKGGTRQQYVLAGDTNMTMTQRNESLTLYFWAGDKICVENY